MRIFVVKIQHFFGFLMYWIGYFGFNNENNSKIYYGNVMECWLALF